MKNLFNTFRINRQKVNYCLLFFPLYLSFISCENFLDVDLPNSQLTTSAVFEDKATATAAMTDIYSKIRDTGLLTGKTNGISNQLGNYADELTFYGSSGSASYQFYNNTLLSTNLQISELWNNTYKQIYAINALIEGVQKSNNITSADKTQLEAEALFTRALLYFYLTNLFGDVPYCETSDYLKNSTISKSTVNEVYLRVIDDLLKAIDSLPLNDISKERVRPNKFAAHALLARVYLYNQRWPEAVYEATTILNNTSVYYLTPTIETVFLKQSTTTIWQFMPALSGKNTDEGFTFYFSKAPPPQSALNAELVNAFTINDLRKKYWIISLNDGAATYYRPYKYKQFNTTSSSLEYSIVFRLAEQYLIRAEANANLGNLSLALKDLNVIRKQAGLQDSNAVSKEEILTAILQERKLEFFTEYGHRFFDLKRNNSLNDKLSKKPGWNTEDILWPIPDSELLINPNLLPQNKGY